MPLKIKIEDLFQSIRLVKLMKGQVNIIMNSEEFNCLFLTVNI